MTLPHVFVIDHLGRPHTMNDERRAHHYTSAKVRKEWKEATIQMCRITKAPKNLDRIGLLIQPIYNKGQLPDPDASAPTAKAILDGLVTGRHKDPSHEGYGVVPDDSGEYVACVCLMAPIMDRSVKPGVRVTITQGGFHAEAPPPSGIEERLPHPEGPLP